MNNAHATYTEARNEILAMFPGQRIRVTGAITLYAEFNNKMIPVTNIKADADEKVRQYRKDGRKHEWRVAKNIINKTAAKAAA